MRIRVYKRGATWWLDYRWNKHRYRYPVGTARKIADNAAALIQAQDGAGKFKGPPSVTIETVSQLMTFSELCTEFLKLKEKKCRPGTVEFYEIKLQNIRAYFGDDRLAVTISPREVEQFEAKRRAEASPADANRHMTVLKGLFKKAVGWSLIDTNPAEATQNTKEQPRERYLTRPEADAILAKADPWMKPVMVAYLATGARRGDLCGDSYGRPVLTWKDVNLEGRMLTIRDTKEGTTRHVPINSDLHAILSSLPSRDIGREVFLDDHGRIVRADRALRSFKDAAAAAEIPDAVTLRLHDLRHTAASWMVQAGVPLYEVQKVLGHKTISMTERYAHFAPDHMKRAVEALTGTAWARASGTPTAQFPIVMETAHEIFVPVGLPN